MQTLKKQVAKILLSVSAFSMLFLAIPVGTALAASPCDQSKPTETSLNNCLNQNPIIKDIQHVVDILSVVVGIVIVGSIIVGGIQYTMAGDNANAVQAAKDRIQNALIALLAFFFIYAFITWLIPGDSFLKNVFN